MRRRVKWLSLCMLLTGLALSFSSIAMGASIGINFYEGTGDDVSGTAGLFPQANWNNLLGGTGGPSALVNDAGAGSGATATWVSNGTWRISGDTPADQNAALIRGYLDTSDSSTTTVTINGLPVDSLWDIVLYIDGDVAEGRIGDYTINGVTLSLQDNANWPISTGGGVFDDGTTDGDGNYLLFSGVVATGGTITMSAVNDFAPSFGRAPLNGAQLIQLITDRAQNPSPISGATDVDINLADQSPAGVLSWNAPDEPNVPVTYDVYFGTTVPDGNCDGPPLVSAGQSGTTYTPSLSLAYDTDYYWRVDVIDPNGGSPFTVKGDCWTFHTVPASPVVSLHPQSQTVPAGSTAVFTAAGLNNPDFQWKKDGSPLANSGNISGADTGTLTISNVQVGDEGFYSCELSNFSGTVETNSARLLTQRLMGWWRLDGDLTDSVDDAVPGAPTHDGSTLRADPNFVTGLINQGYEFFSNDPNVIVIADPDYFNFHRRGMTISTWVKTDTGSWIGIISKHTPSTAGWVLDINGGDNDGEGSATFALRGSHGDLFGSCGDGCGVSDNEWHLFTATVDPATTTSKLYVDGRYREESVIYNVANASQSPNPLTIGAEGPNNQTPYDGLVDEVKIWSYALSDLEVANEYRTGFDVTVCIGDPVDRANPQFDFNGDCTTNVLDFGLFTGGWLECYQVPDCIN